MLELDQKRQKVKIKRELILNAFRSGISSMKEKQGRGLKILTPKEMLQRLPISLAQLKTGNTSENWTKT